MPNTLAHIGLQVPLTRLGIKQAPLQWIVLGCIIPDIPWIVQRVVLSLSTIDPISLNLYASIQASLLFCLLLSLALAMLGNNSRTLFFILGTNSLLHLLFDACQSKWGNGVNFLLPFSWHSINFGLFWPDQTLSFVFTAMGAAVFLFLWPKTLSLPPLLTKPDRGKTIILLFAAAFYLLAPCPLINKAQEANLHHSRTLSETAARPGKQLTLDRAEYSAATESIRCYSGEIFKVWPPLPPETTIVSIRALFTDTKTLKILQYQTQNTNRDYPTYAGLLLCLLLWTHTLLSRVILTHSPRNPQ